MAKATTAGSRTRSAARRRAAHQPDAPPGPSSLRVLVLFGLVATLVVAGAVLLLLRQGAGQPSRPAQLAAPAPPSQGAAAQVDWKVKGPPTAPVLVEEWGDFQ